MAGEKYWRCRRCGRVYQSEGVCHECWNPVEGLAYTEPVVVLPVAEYERLQGIEARVRDNSLACSIADEADNSASRGIRDYRRAVLGEEETR